MWNSLFSPTTKPKGAAAPSKKAHEGAFDSSMFQHDADDDALDGSPPLSWPFSSRRSLEEI